MSEPKPKRRRAPSRLGTWLGNAAAYVGIFLLWLLHFLPLPLLAALGKGVAWLLWRVARSRRRIALVNLQLCFPELSEAKRVALAKEHFVWLTRSLLERCLLWFASNERLLRMVQVEGDISRAERSGEPVMWLLPHFVGLDFTAPPLMLLQKRPAIDVYQRQSNAVMDARLMQARARFGPERSMLVDRSAGIRPVIRAINAGAGFVNAPDQDFGRKDSAFVPFFGVPACTLLAPARMARSMGMLVQPIVVTMLPGGQGYRVKFCDTPAGFDDPDPEVAAVAMNRWLEERIRENPAQYLWVHRRFKTRPPGEPGFY